jgi:hypothetical protein
VAGCAEIIDLSLKSAPRLAGATRGPAPATECFVCPVILILAIAAMVGLGFLAMITILRIAMRTEGRCLSPASAPHTRMQRMARRLVGLYVRREREETPFRSDVRQ